MSVAADFSVGQRCLLTHQSLKSDMHESLAGNGGNIDTDLICLGIRLAKLVRCTNPWLSAAGTLTERRG